MVVPFCGSYLGSPYGNPKKGTAMEITSKLPAFYRLSGSGGFCLRAVHSVAYFVEGSFIRGLPDGAFVELAESL